jgi:hypothetical protein
MSHFRLASHVTGDALLDFTICLCLALVLTKMFCPRMSALDLTVCIRDADRPNEHGFYLITVKASQQAGLTGLKGGIVRKVAVGKTRSSLEHSLTAIKQRVEAAPR